MTRLTVALAALLCFTPAVANMAFPPQDDIVQKYFAIACEYSECGSLTAPMVVFMDTGRALGYYYFDTDTVFVTQECLYERVADQTKCQAVLIHEMTHYIRWHLDGLKGCESEAAAWDVYNAYVIDKGRLDLVRENWTESYPRCQK